MAATTRLELPVVSSGSAKPGRTVSIELTAEESAIFAVLLETVKAKGLSCKVRVAGGWVRDKIMGRSSHDIDVALDTLKGVEFATAVNEYLTSKGESTSSVGVIQANPEQSKHLETATAKVLGLWLDFVHLRAEVYEPGSRIPVVAMGTPAQDAERRDFTINSLLFNLSDGCIEDWTGLGLSDLEARVLRTPLPAAVTFRDDPLRVLRAVRFASRFGFTMEPALRAAASDAGVHADLAGKVSRERYGIEVDGMLSANGRPVAALRALHALGLTGLVLAPPPGKLGGHMVLPGLTPDSPAASALPADVVHAAASYAAVAAEAAEAAAASASAAGGSSESAAGAGAGAGAEGKKDRLMPGTAAAKDKAAAVPGIVLPPSWPAVGLAVLEATAYLCSIATRAPEVAGWLTHPSAPAPDGSDAGMTALMLAVTPWPALGFHAETNPWAAVPETSPDESVACGLGPEDRRLLFLAAQLSPLAHVHRITPKGKEEAIVPVILTESIKRRSKDGADVQAILAGARALTAVADAAAAGAGDGVPDRLALGMALRTVAKEHWRSAVLLAVAMKLLPVLLDPACRAVHPVGAPTGVPQASAARIAACIRPFARLHACVAAWHLDGCWEWKHVLSGAEVLSGLGVKPGPALGLLMDELIRWQLVHRPPPPPAQPQSGSAAAAAQAAGGAAAGGSASAGAAGHAHSHASRGHPPAPYTDADKADALAHLKGLVEGAGGVLAFVSKHSEPTHGTAQGHRT